MSGPIEWSVAGQPLPDEDESGDGWVVAETVGATLFGVIDGLGHGHWAAVAAGQAVTLPRITAMWLAQASQTTTLTRWQSPQDGAPDASRCSSRARSSGPPILTHQRARRWLPCAP